MLLKYNINNIRQKRKLLDVNRVDVTKKDDCYIINVETKTPHNLKTNDVILLQHDIKKFSNYTEANEKGKNNDIVFIEKPQTILEKDIKGDDVEVVYGSGYYQKINNKFRKISQNSISIILNKYNSFHDKLKVICDENDIFKFKIILKRYKELRVKSVTDSEKHGVFIVSGNIPMLLNKNDTFNVIRKTFKYKYFDADNGLDNLLKVDENPNEKSVNLGSDYVVFNGNIYVWTPIKEKIQCTYINENTYSYPYECTKHIDKEHICEYVIIEENDILEIEDTRFIIENKVDIKPRTNIGVMANPPITGDIEIIPPVDGDTDVISIIELNPNVKIYEYEEYINVSLPISSTNLTELNHELNTKIYFDEIKNELIPEIKDYEKKYFIPLYKNRKGDLKYISKMNFNIFLRSRDKNDESWNTNDTKWWNQYGMDSEGKFRLKDNGKYETENGDLLVYLGFNDEDIRYRKKKVDKSFLRLSFYNTPNPTTQMLLFYSTIFLDSGELYTKYIKNIINENRETGPIVFQNKFGENNLTLSFSVTDRYDMTKSSEGFYLYLFPDGLENNKTRKLYMKAEFNHAGNGKTVPLIFPNDKKQPLKFNDDFPKSLLTDDGDLTELYRQLYIPLTIEYSEERNEYFYYFDLTEFNEDKQEITFGLYEPKINPID